jgi:AcrR family transcriptional regulator
MTANRSGKGTKQRGQVVRDKLLAATERLTLLSHPENIALTDVMEAADVARATVYHHFGDLEGLIGAATLRLYSRNVRDDLAAIEQVIEGANNVDEFADQMRLITGIANGEERRQYRLLRASCIDYARGRPVLVEQLADIQTSLTDDLAKAIAKAQHKALIREDLDPRAFAVFIQAYSLGKLVDDVAGLHTSAGAWDYLIDTLVIKPSLASSSDTA